MDKMKKTLYFLHSSTQRTQRIFVFFVLPFSVLCIEELPMLSWIQMLFQAYVN